MVLHIQLSFFLRTSFVLLFVTKHLLKLSISLENSQQRHVLAGYFITTLMANHQFRNPLAASHPTNQEGLNVIFYFINVYNSQTIRTES